MTTWTVATARQNFTSLLEASRLSVQPIYRHHQLVAAVVDAATYQRLQQQHLQQPSLADTFRDLRQLIKAEDALPVIPRHTRANSFAEGLAD
ncbi:hypothetical protein [Thiothrix winogradskyi]|jgi:hypothetical protein|uniref:Antitoxin n=1 Tax=Thiothrix winogradskyi TaxID=96472 RepID=A0ABY3SVB8_9GAMM|nr:hypothetical protein [Thiothrix winogradskyi]UJS23341.1 hypothetical protein L2Y54_15515 [Thiothrix winogradskyi]